MRAPLSDAQSKQTTYVAAIDGLRAIAVLSVVAFHIGMPGFPGGFAGVDVFFVISGYLITRLLQEEVHARGTVSLPSFYARRVRRLLPALAAMLLVTATLGAFILFPDELPRLRTSTNGVALAYSNLQFMQFAGGYFDPAVETMPLLHTWSLGVEEQYYLAWPLILIALANLGGRANFDRRLISALIAILLVSYAACLWYSFHAQEKAFYLMPLRAWELACGALIQQIQSRLSVSRVVSRTSIWIGFALIAVFVANPTMAQPFPGVGALLPVLGCAAMLLGLANANSSMPEMRWLGSPPLRVLGLLSYSWYLWHWPVLALSRAYFLNLGGLERNIPLMVLALGLAALTYRYIETPVRSGRVKFFATTRSSLISGASIMAAVLAVTSIVLHYQIEAGEHMTASWSHTEDGVLYGMSKCGQSPEDKQLVPASQCTYGESKEAPALVIWGDSHAGALSDLADTFAQEFHSSVLLRAAIACPALPGVTPVDRGRVIMVCAHNSGLVERELLDLAGKGTKGVLLATRWNYYIGLTPTDPGGGHFQAIVPVDANGQPPSIDGLEVGNAPLDNRNSLVAMERSLRATVTKLNAAGLRVMILAPVPELPYMAPHCLYRRSPEQCVIPRAPVDARRAAVLALLNRLAAEMPALRIWDPIDEFCDASQCYTYRNGMLLYGDDDHISRQMARHLFQQGNRELRWLARLP